MKIRLSIFSLVFCFALHALAQDAPRPHITGLSHVAFYVHDIEKSRQFYKDYLGFAEPYSVNNDDGTLRLTWIKINDRQTIELFPEKQAGTDRLYHIALETDDADAMRKYLASQGIKAPDATPKGKIGNLNFTIPDPDGHGVEFVQYMPDGWTMQNAGKFMPDTRIATRMSHAGILVGALPRTLRFYHDVLGLDETWRGSRDGVKLSWANLKVPGGNDYIELMLYEILPEPTNRGTSHHICLEVPDVAKAWAILQTRTLPAECKTPTAMKVGVNGKRQINLYDPDGTRVEIMEAQTADGKPVPPSTAPAPTSRPATMP